MLAFSNDYYGMIFRATQSVELFCAYVQSIVTSLITTLFLRKNENIKVIEALKAKEFEKITEKLLESGRLSYFEFYKCNNF